MCGNPGEAVKHILLIHDETELSAEALLNKIKEYVRSQRNIALDCVAFEERKQAIGESFDAFYIAIKTLARDADLCDSCMDRRLVTKIMSGIRDKETRMKLLAISPLPDLQKVTDLCRSEESAKLDEARMSRAKSEKNVYELDPSLKTYLNPVPAVDAVDLHAHPKDKLCAQQPAKHA